MNQPSGNRFLDPVLCRAYMYKQFAFVCTLMTMMLVVSGCNMIRSQQAPASPLPAINRDEAIDPTERAMFDDLTGIVVQVFEPLSTTLQINRDNDDPRMQYFVASLAKAGFGIQRVSADQGANYLSYRHERKPDVDEVHLSVTVGAVNISRNYRLLSERRISPASVVKLSGTRMPVVVEDIESRRFRIEDQSLSDARYVASLDLEEPSPIISLITPEVVSGLSQRAANGPSLRGLNSSMMEVNNLFYDNQSTFASVLENYRRVDRQIIIFANDSLVLGDTNKQLIEQFVDTKMQEKDLISLIGCSNGPTALAIGNEGLALGRAKRVTQALMARGVAREQVLDEGCWAPTNVRDRFPSRGVVMELWRSNT